MSDRVTPGGDAGADDDPGGDTSGPAAHARPAPPYQIAVLGDVGGHAFLLRRAVQVLGGDPGTGALPGDVVVVQVGDLIDKGPDSRGCVALVDRLLAASPANWVQLLGNHEAQYLGGPVFWPDAAPGVVEEHVRRWASSGRARLAVALDTVELGPVLVTHSGLTRQKWMRMGEPDDPADAARCLNEELARSPDRAFVAGEMLGVRPRGPVGVTWASPGELLLSWDFETLPFTQVHGHASPRLWRIGLWAPELPDRMTATAWFDETCRHTDIVWPEGRHIICVDPDYGRDEAAVPLTPFVLTGEVLDA